MSVRALAIGIVLILAAGVATWLLWPEGENPLPALSNEPSDTALEAVPPDTAFQLPDADIQGAPNPEAAMLEIGATAPDFQLERLDGGTFSLSSHRDRLVLLNFWATWCAPCRDEMPDLQQIYDELAGEGLLVVGVSLDEDGRAVVREFHQTFPVEYPLLLNGLSVATRYGADYAVPTTYIIDREGRIADRHVGAITKDDYLPRIRELLNTSSG